MLNKIFITTFLASSILFANSENSFKADVLTGERKDEAEGVGIGGFTISDLLDKMKGGQ